MFNDPIAELLTKLRNAKDAEHRYVDISYSKMKAEILEILKKHGFIENYLVNEAARKMRIFLRYVKNRKNVLNGMKRQSSPGGRKYVEVQEIPKVFNGMGISILSTNKGVVDGDTARSLNVGGELLCTVW